MLKIICSIVFNFSFISMVLAQSPTALLKYADSLLTEGNFRQAETEYRRLLYFDNSSNDYLVYRKLAHCAAGDNEFDKAIYNFDTALSFCKSDSIRVEIVLEKCKYNMLHKNFLIANAGFYQIDKTYNKEQKYKLTLYKGIVNFGFNNYDNALLYFSQLIHPDSTEQQKQLKQLLIDNRKLKRPSPTVAKVMSIFIPGSGQIYAGKTADGINSMLINMALIGVGIAMYKSYSLFDVVLSVSPWFMRYYNGGIKNAVRHAHNKREQNRNSVFNKTLMLVKR